MTTMITEANKTATGTYVQATCGNVSALVCIQSHGVQVICQNAAHKVWRGMGRRFESVELALANYKSGEMRAIIQAAAAV